jgi:uncharacterized protein YraI
MPQTGRLTRGLTAHSRRATDVVGWRITLVLILFLTFLSATQSPASAAEESYVATDVLYLRSAPTSDASVTAEMYYGEYVAVIDGPTEHGWYFVDYAGMQGWAHGRYLSFGGPPSGSSGSEPVGGEGGSAWVDTDVLNVRAEPSTDAWVMGSASQGAELAIVGDPVEGFYPIAYGSEIGWVAGKYLSWQTVDGGAERWIIVDRGSSTVNLMVGNDVVASYWAAMGFDTSEDGFYATALGTYYVYEKNAELTWTDWAKGYIQYWVAFDPDRYNGFHGYTMNKRGNVIDGGNGPTGGCVALDPSFAAAVYEFVTFGTRVEVRW